MQLTGLTAFNKSILNNPWCLQDGHTPGKLRPVPEAQRMASSGGDQRDYIGGADLASGKVDQVTRARITGARWAVLPMLFVPQCAVLAVVSVCWCRCADFFNVC